jgi:hypothetical protein
MVGTAGGDELTEGDTAALAADAGHGYEVGRRC